MNLSQSSDTRVSWFKRYGFAALAAIVATAMRLWLRGVLPESQIFPTFFLAVLLVAGIAGAGPAVFTTVLSCLSALYFFIDPRSLFVGPESDLLRLLVFLIIGLSVAGFAAAATRARQYAIASEVALADARSRALTQATLLERESFIKGVLDSLPHEIAVIDATGVVIAVNRRWERFGAENRGPHDTALLGSNYLQVCRTAADQGDGFAHLALAELERILNGETAQVVLEYPCHSPDAQRWFLMHATRADCAPAAVVISHTDITERVEVEWRLHAATARLRAQDQRKDEFLATLGHELRNPLASIRYAVDVFRYDASTGRKNQSDILLSMIDRQVTHLVRLVDDLLEVSRITRGKIELRKQSVELSGALRHAIDAAKPALERGAHRLEVTTPSQPLTLEADPVRLAQIFTNLLNNAAKYTPNGGAISVDAQKDGDEAKVTIRDTGVGIAPEMLPRIFEMFTRADNSAEVTMDGLGIGLALVKSLVELHGGRVEAQSDGVGRGSAFIVHLPLHQEEASGASRDP